MNGISAYKEHAVVTQSPGQLIVLLYDGAVKYLRQAIAAIENKDFELKAECFSKALSIINELDCCLDMEGGEEVATNLRRLYGFMRQHLAAAGLKLDTQAVRDVIAVLEDLNEGWKAITA